MSLYEIERDQACAGLEAMGQKATDFAFLMTYLPPDTDDGAMFTTRYKVTVMAVESGTSTDYVGGIGLRWVEKFLTDVDASMSQARKS